MKVLRLKREIDGYICDRLQEALWREALHIIDKDIVSPEEIDDSIIYSAGLRWAFMGPFLTFHLAGGDGGMRHFLAQFDPTLELPWTDLTFPKWSKQLEDRIIDGCEQSYGSASVSEWETKRNDILVDIMNVLEKHGIAAGTTVPKN
jgi:carnitine 3-dehydrogenase